MLKYFSKIKSSKPSFLPSFGNKKESNYAASNAGSSVDGDASNAAKAKNADNLSVATGKKKPSHPAAEWSANKFKAAKLPIDGLKINI